MTRQQFIITLISSCVAAFVLGSGLSVQVSLNANAEQVNALNVKIQRGQNADYTLRELGRDCLQAAQTDDQIRGVLKEIGVDLNSSMAQPPAAGGTNSVSNHAAPSPSPSQPTTATTTPKPTAKPTPHH